METGAILSECRNYRYALWRIWDDSLPVCNFIMLNPSTADETEDDPTIRRVIGYATDWDYGGVYVTNLFALRATDPKELRNHVDPVGPENNDVLIECSSHSPLILCAWGNHGKLNNRSTEVVELLGERNLHCLKVSKNEEPMHPLYQKKDLKPIILRERNESR